jgi:hypothetical protein
MRPLLLACISFRAAASLRRTGLLVVAILALGTTGCHTTNSSDSLASVTIKDRSLDQIVGATEAVFRAHGFQGGRKGLADLSFEKAGNVGDNIAYGNWFGGGTTRRVTVTLRGKGDGTVVVACTAELVQNAGDPFFEDTHKIRRKGFQKLLDEVRDRLK